MRMFVTGAAGFIGSHVVERMLADAHEVVGFDRIPPRPARYSCREADGQFQFIEGDIANTAAVSEAMRGADVVWHFAASADIPGGARATDLDLTSSVLGTQCILEAMRESGVSDLVFPSTSAVYGPNPPRPVPETHGPLLPTSLYGAGKVGAESLVSAYCHLFGTRAWIFRLGNAVGGRMTRGVIRDFVHKLTCDPSSLTILGSGRQTKSYVLVDDVVDGIATIRATHALTSSQPCEVVNIAAAGGLDVRAVAKIVAAEMGTDPVFRVTGSELSWPGDQPIVELDVAKAARLGWRAAHDSATAVKVAARRLIGADAGALR